MTVWHFLFEDFEALDMMGPCEVFGFVGGWTQRYLSLHGGPVRARQGFVVDTEPVERASGGVLLLPGGPGTRPLAGDALFAEALKAAADRVDVVMTVCTGSALLARTGLLDGRRATSNKRSFEWVREQGPKVDWQPAARWVVDGRYWTSSGISAGTDMALGFAADCLGRAEASAIATRMEYCWNQNREDDPFAVGGQQ